MTVDEELGHLEDSFRRLKIDYDVYFGGASKRPPYDAQSHVESIIKKYNDNPRLSFGQRFRFNGIVQKFAVHSEMWRQRVKRREEGREQPSERRHAPPPPPPAPAGFRVQWNDPEQETEKVDKLFQALISAK